MKTIKINLELNKEKFENAQVVLNDLGMSFNEAIDKFTQMIVLNKKLPFELPPQNQKEILTSETTQVKKELKAKAINYVPLILKKDDHYALNAIHIRKGLYGGYRIIELKKPNSPDQEEMKEELLYENDEMSLERAEGMALEYAIEENEENGNFYKFIFLPLD